MAKLLPKLLSDLTLHKYAVREWAASAHSRTVY